jgi:hypothetical protein
MALSCADPAQTDRHRVAPCGYLGERVAAAHLESRCRIVERNFRVNGAELDLVTMRRRVGVDADQGPRHAALGDEVRCCAIPINARS